MGEDNITNSIKKEIQRLRKFKYSDLCIYLKNKYGTVSGSYFINHNCKTKNEKIKRTSEGLFIHHVYESKAIMLSHSEYAIKFPFEWQEGANLVYCNYLEHLLLHVAIVKEFLKTEAKKTKMAVGIGGLINYIIPEIIDYINGYDYARDYMKKALSVIDGNEMLFIEIIENLENYILNDFETFSIIRNSSGGARRHMLDCFKYGKMTNNGRFNDLLFKYDVIKRHIKLADSAQILAMIEKSLNNPGYDYVFDVRPHGEYYYVSYHYYNSRGNISSVKECAIPSSDPIDFEKIKREHFKEMFIAGNLRYLVKKESVISFKEIKNSKTVHKKYCLTIDGIVVKNHKFTKEQAIDLVDKNRQ